MVATHKKERNLHKVVDRLGICEGLTRLVQLSHNTLSYQEESTQHYRLRSSEGIHTIFINENRRFFIRVSVRGNGKVTSDLTKSTGSLFTQKQRDILAQDILAKAAHHAIALGYVKPEVLLKNPPNNMFVAKAFRLGVTRASATLQRLGHVEDLFGAEKSLILISALSDKRLDFKRGKSYFHGSEWDLRHTHSLTTRASGGLTQAADIHVSGTGCIGTINAYPNPERPETWANSAQDVLARVTSAAIVGGHLDSQVLLENLPKNKFAAAALEIGAHRGKKIAEECHVQLGLSISDKDVITIRETRLREEASRSDGLHPAPGSNFGLF